uniref:Uncharacterized protein n=1 Tax=Anguilla anguilla TaxID=7936 RepID=A0A0E9QWV6_ANGAN
MESNFLFSPVSISEVSPRYKPNTSYQEYEQNPFIQKHIKGFKLVTCKVYFV